MDCYRCGSTDCSKEYIESVAIKPYAIIPFGSSEPDNGIFNAMNMGIAKENGGYFNFMNSCDDFLIMTPWLFFELISGNKGDVFSVYICGLRYR